MKTITNFIQERLKLNSDSKIFKEKQYLVFPISPDYSTFVDLYPKYKPISYTDDIDSDNDFDIFIVSEHDIHDMCEEFDTYSQTTIWELPDEFNVNEFKKWFIKKSNQFYHYREVIDKINEKYKFEVKKVEELRY